MDYFYYLGKKNVMFQDDGSVILLNFKLFIDEK